MNINNLISYKDYYLRYKNKAINEYNSTEEVLNEFIEFLSVISIK